MSTTIAAASKNAITEFITAATVLNRYVIFSGITAHTIETTASTIITNAKNETISDVSAISNEPKFHRPENKSLKFENKSEISKSVYVLSVPELVKIVTQLEQTAIKTITFITADTIFEVKFAFFTINYPFFIRYIHYIPKFRYNQPQISTNFILTNFSKTVSKNIFREKTPFFRLFSFFTSILTDFLCKNSFYFGKTAFFVKIVLLIFDIYVKNCK